MKNCECNKCKDILDYGFSVWHDSDCVVHNEPACKNGKCDCALKSIDTNSLLTCPLCGEKDMDALAMFYEGLTTDISRLSAGWSGLAVFLL